MSKPGQRQRPSLHRVGFNERISPDDILARLIDKDQREAADNRTAAERWLGDPPADRSALAERRRTQSANSVVRLAVRA
jgi:hypothetical protein